MKTWNAGWGKPDYGAPCAPWAPAGISRDRLRHALDQTWDEQQIRRIDHLEEAEPSELTSILEHETEATLLALKRVAKLCGVDW